MTTYHKGEQYTVSTRFKRKGAPVAFVNPPRWTLYNSAEQEMLTGVANNVGDSWEANFSIPTGYVVDGGTEELTLQFVAYDATNREYIRDYELTLEDTEDTFVPDGVLYNALTQQPVTDTLVLPTPNATVGAQIFDPMGNEIVSKPASSTNSVGRTSSGYLYPFEFDLTGVVTANRWTDPCHIIYNVNGATDEMHPLYILDAKTLSVVNSLKVFLDKARLVEIDPSLQWHLVELVQSVLEGVKTINAYEPEGTFWTTANFPPTLDRYLFAASAVYALNMRAMAEGLTGFEFSGLNTNLNYNRMEVLQSKIDEMNNILERLPLAKRSAIAISGKGTAPAGVTDNRKRNLGVLRVGINNLNNRSGYSGRGRFLLR